MNPTEGLTYFLIRSWSSTVFCSTMKKRPTFSSVLKWRVLEPVQFTYNKLRDNWILLLSKPSQSSITVIPKCAPPHPPRIFHVYPFLEICSIALGHVFRLGHYKVIWLRGNDMKKWQAVIKIKYFSLLWASYDLNPPRCRRTLCLNCLQNVCILHFYSCIKSGCLLSTLSFQISRLIQYNQSQFYVLIVLLNKWE